MAPESLERGRVRAVESATGRAFPSTGGARSPIPSYPPQKNEKEPKYICVASNGLVRRSSTVHGTESADTERQLVQVKLLRVVVKRPGHHLGAIGRVVDGDRTLSHRSWRVMRRPRGHPTIGCLPWRLCAHREERAERAGFASAANNFVRANGFAETTVCFGAVLALPFERIRYFIIVPRRDVNVRSLAHHLRDPCLPKLPMTFLRVLIDDPACEVAHLM